MSKVFIDGDSVRNLSSEAFNALLLEYTNHLKSRGHSDRTVKSYLNSATHFIQWLAQSSSSHMMITPEAVQVFLYQHLSVCSCPQPAPKRLKNVRAALNRLLLMLGQDRFCMHAPCASGDIEMSICQFDAYMRDVCGLARETRGSRCRFIRDFLDTQFGSLPLDFGRITAQALTQYVTEQAHHYRPGTMGVLACSLRCYLHFLQLKGTVSPGIGDTIPTPPNWSLAALPASLSQEELARFWKAFDRSTAVGKRDFAMARCLVDLALRCQEVASMYLEAIDWRTGVLHLPQTKSQRGDLLPLPEITGKALVDYLRYGRPSCETRAIFVHHRAPLGKAVATTTVRGAIRRAFSRAGLPWSGTHVLRHTVATRLLQAGNSLKEIADVLRHRCLDTTIIYTKVDLPNLTRVALPWPEQRS
jgi:site-specific recombinase XerD